MLAGSPEYRLNKVVIPNDPKDPKKQLEYGRAFFDLSELKLVDNIKEALEADPVFSKHIEVQNYTQQTANPNMLFIKGFTKKGESSKGLEGEMKEFFEKLNPGTEVCSVYLRDYEGDEGGAWGYVTFGTGDQCRAAHRKLRDLKTSFRGNTIFSNVKNMFDPRVVIISNLKPTATKQQVESFLNKIAASSKKVPQAEESKEEPAAENRIFEYYDTNILPSKKIVGYGGKEVEVPYRVVVVFKNRLKKELLDELLGEIRGLPEHKELFDSDLIRVHRPPIRQIQGHWDSGEERYVPHFRDKEDEDKVRRVPAEGRVSMK